MRDYHLIDGAALDRHITGNYGEDQYRDLVECPECDAMVDKYEETCNCGWQLPPNEPDPDVEYDRKRDEAMLKEGD